MKSNQFFNDFSSLTKFSLAIWLLFLAQGCMSTPIGYEDNITEAKQETIHRETPVPAISSDDEYISNTETAHVKLPPGILLKWLFHCPLEKLLLGTEDIAPVIRTDHLTNSWGTPGSRRRVVLGDGNTALEELLVYEEDKGFKYIVWNFTNEARMVTNYAIGEFVITDKDGGSDITWAYKFQKKSCLTGMILSDFVKNDYKGYMQVCMKAIKELAIKENIQTNCLETGQLNMF